MIGENLLGGANKMMKLINNHMAGGTPEENYLTLNEGETLRDGKLTAALQFYKISIPGRAEWEAAGYSLTAEEVANYDRIKTGITEAQLTGQSNGIPTILVYGRADEVVQVNHGSRAYYARYLLQGGDDARMAVLEIENGRHLEMYNGLLPDFGVHSTYLHPYYEDAVGMMIDHLKNGTALPGDQIVRALAKGAGDITAAMFPPIQMTPDPADAITWDPATNTLTIAD